MSCLWCKPIHFHLSHYNACHTETYSLCCSEDSWLETLEFCVSCWIALWTVSHWLPLRAPYVHRTAQVACYPPPLLPEREITQRTVEYSGSRGTCYSEKVSNRGRCHSLQSIYSQQPKKQLCSRTLLKTQLHVCTNSMSVQNVVTSWYSIYNL